MGSFSSHCFGLPSRAFLGVILVCLLVLTAGGGAAIAGTDMVPEHPSGGTGTQSPTPIRILVIGGVVLAFGLILSMAFVAIAWRSGKGLSELLMKTVGLIVVITAGLFLIVTGYGENQIASMIGLLGTIAGYLLGREARPATPDSRDPDPGLATTP